MIGRRKFIAGLLGRLSAKGTLRFLPIFKGGPFDSFSHWERKRSVLLGLVGACLALTPLPPL
jgi:hypothetical protein